MSRKEEIRAVCVEVLSKNGIEDSFVHDCAEKIASRLVEDNYVKFNEVFLDPGKAVQIIADIMNRFQEERPFVSKE